MELKKRGGYSFAELKTGGCSATEFGSCHWCRELKDADYSAAELKAAGRCASAMKAAGFSAAQLKAAGYSSQSLKNIGYSTFELLAEGIL